MIPKRVRLSGFLCYKDEQEIAFDGSTLWMLAGLNGSGKSTIFDAVTYALFGHHRGGAQAAAELINKDSKTLGVDFEFTVDEQLYQIRRTLRRDAKGGAKGTQNVFRWDKPKDGEGKWAAVADTNLSDGFKAWVREKIGLNYDTFTSSVLLLQGRAEKLLDSKPSGRAEVLAGIVDLERYQNLHEKADTQRKRTKAQLEALENQMSGIPDVTDIEILAAENRLLDAEEARMKAASEIEKLQEREFQAKQWNDLQARLAELKGRWEKAKTIIAEAADIEKAYHRLTTLNVVIPQVLTIQEKQSAIAGSEKNTAQLTKLMGQSKEDESKHLLGIDGEKLKREKLQKNLATDEKKLADLSVKLRDLSGQLSQVTLYEVEHVRLKQTQADLGRLPANVAELVREAETDYERKQDLGRVVPLLERFVSTRTQLLSAIKQYDDAKEREAKTIERGHVARKVADESKAKLDEATSQRAKADEGATEARTIYAQAKTAAEEIEKNEGASLCRACGQKLTPGHILEEKAKRDKDLKATAKRHKETVDVQKTAVSVETAARDQFETADKDLQKLREDLRETKGLRQQAEKDRDRLTTEVREAYLALPEAEREHIAEHMPDDWATTTWPTANDVAVLKREAGDREAARSTLTSLRAQLSRFETLQAQRKTTQTTLDQLRATLPPGDPAKLREQETHLKADEEATNIKVASAKRQIKEADQAIDNLNRELETVRGTLSQLAAQLSAEEATRTQLRDAIDRAAKLLPDDWRESAVKAGFAEQNKWKSELEDLKRKKIDERYKELALTRAGIEKMREDMALLDTEAKAFPAEAQCAPEIIKGQLAAAKKVSQTADEALQKAREEKAILDGHSKQRKQLREQTLTLDKDLNFSTLLAQLLGRDRLQRHLVRTAERHIVEYANSILDRLSGGQLYLRLCGSEDGAGTERALELEAYNRQTGGNAINVAFLSGSQRFRVAVSLALGIGQYASKQHRPIESVIIDEGFGCLDRNGRQVMIQELQNLRGHLQCILLVSHQEEFADAFPDGYRFELSDGATKISRFQR